MCSWIAVVMQMNERRTSMKPGDLIKWVYRNNSQPVNEDVKLWFTPMQRLVPIGVHPAILISITDKLYMWLTPDGLFHARVDFHEGHKHSQFDSRVMPRTMMTNDGEEK
jgi:hypothetical protein